MAPALLRSRLVIGALLCILLSSDVGVLRRAAALGINYGQVANNLPSPPQVVSLLSSLCIGKVRIYDVNPQVLSSFAGTGIELIVTVPDDLVPPMAASQAQALQWITASVRPYFPATRVTGIAVGNEVFTGDDEQLKASLVPAMRNLHAALAQLGMDGYVHVSTANSLAVLATSYPPSQGTFTQEAASYMAQLLRFLAETNAPFWINAYPYFAYKDDPTRVSLDYALSNKSHVGAVDPNTRLQYTSMLYAQVDAVTFAAARLGYGNVPVHVSETGWPSKGDANEVGATVENARAYNRNLLVRQVSGEGTPLRPKLRLEVYLFALFNENMKPGPSSERNYGLYQPDGTMVYNVGLVQQRSTTSAASLSLAISPANKRDVRKDFAGICLFTSSAILLITQAFLL
ncbi:glucan endo-1,3-beta-glucosidase 14-like [Phragmites australis]|uniref:glucan endo-1,3-beta-glucosidase 14-like n=1 Tax=Phragmites australis TaxID=29695 RepID=UPI002D795008|nr:glucan endo-1,3-beta-glucosidase 14-like [Phragmites australis]